MTITREQRKNKWGKPTSRWYSTPAGKFPSVTTVLQVAPKPALVAWAAKLERQYVVDEATKLYAEYGSRGYPSEFFGSTLVTRLSKQKQHVKALETAGDIGTRIHALCELHSGDRGAYENAMSFVTSDTPEWFALKAWEKWATDHQVKPIRTEEVVYHKTHGYAGSFDMLAEVDGKVWLLDYKSSSGIYDSMFWQLASYAEAWFDMGNGMPAESAVVRLPKAAGDEIEVRLVPDHERAFEAFIACLNLWRCLNPEAE